VPPQVLLPWERLLWSGRPWRLALRLAGERYLLTDFRLLRHSRRGVAEIALDDVGEIHRAESAIDRVLGTSTIAVHPRSGRDPIHLTSVRRGAQLAALLELLAGDPHAPRDAEAVQSALAWEPRTPAIDLRGALAGFVGVLVAIVLFLRKHPGLAYRVLSDEVVVLLPIGIALTRVVNFVNDELWGRICVPDRPVCIVPGNTMTWGQNYRYPSQPFEMLLDIATLPSLLVLYRQRLPDGVGGWGAFTQYGLTLSLAPKHRLDQRAAHALVPCRRVAGDGAHAAYPGALVPERAPPPRRGCGGAGRPVGPGGGVTSKVMRRPGGGSRTMPLSTAARRATTPSTRVSTASGGLGASRAAPSHPIPSIAMPGAARYQNCSIDASRSRMEPSPAAAAVAAASGPGRRLARSNQAKRSSTAMSWTEGAALWTVIEAASTPGPWGLSNQSHPAGRVRVARL